MTVGSKVRIRRLPQHASRRFFVGQVGQVVAVHPLGTGEVEIRVPDIGERRILIAHLEPVAETEYRKQVDGGYGS